MKFSSLQDLKQVQKALREAHARAQAERQAQEAAVLKREAERHLFARAVGPVQPLPDRRQAQASRSPVPPVPAQRQKDEQAVLRDAYDSVKLLDQLAEGVRQRRLVLADK